MRFLPFDNFQIQSNLSNSAAKQRLEECIATKEGKGWSVITNSFSGEDYKGSVTGDSFRITRVIKYRNSFLPVIKGRFIDDHPGTIIEVSMRLSKFVYVFLSFWLVFIFIALVAALTGLALEPMIPLGMLVFAYLLAMAGYKYEAGRSRKFLKKLFESKDE